MSGSNCRARSRWYQSAWRARHCLRKVGLSLRRCFDDAAQPRAVGRGGGHRQCQFELAGDADERGDQRERVAVADEQDPSGTFPRREDDASGGGLAVTTGRPVRLVLDRGEVEVLRDGERFTFRETPREPPSTCRRRRRWPKWSRAAGSRARSPAPPTRLIASSTGGHRARAMEVDARRGESRTRCSRSWKLSDRERGAQQAR